MLQFIYIFNLRKHLLLETERSDLESKNITLNITGINCYFLSFTKKLYMYFYICIYLPKNYICIIAW